MARVLAGVVTAIILAACGSAASSGGRSTHTAPKPAKQAPAQVIDIYSSLPRSGPQAAEGIAIAQGIKLGLAALEQPAEHANGYRLVYKSLNDARPNGWNATMTADNAERAASDPAAAIYIGELNSGATEISLPILNQAGIVELTPGSSYIGLTNTVKDVTPATEPDRFYPNVKLRSLLRLVPNEMVQTAAMLDALVKMGSCPSERVAAVSFGGTPYADSEVLATQVTAPDYNLTFVPSKLPAAATAAELTAYVAALHTQSVGCLVLTGRSTATSAALVRLVRADLPHDLLIGTSGYCNARLTVADWYCASPVLPLPDYSGGGAYAKDYKRLISRKRAPSAYGVYGFMAAEVAVTAIDELTHEGGSDVRSQLQRTLLGGDLVQSSEMIGAVEFDDRGNLTNYRRVGIYRANPRGRMEYFTSVSPTKVVGGY